MRLSILNGTHGCNGDCDCENCAPTVSVVNGMPSRVNPSMNGMPSRVDPMNGFYPDSMAIESVINGAGMDEDEAVAYELAVILGDQDAMNGLEDDESLNGWRDKRKERKAARQERRAEKKEAKEDKKRARKDRRANTPGKNRRAQRRDERTARRQRRQERHEKRMSGEGGGFFDSVKELAGGFADRLSGKAMEAGEALWEEGIDADPFMMDELDREGAFRDLPGGGEDGRNNMMMLGLLAVGAFLLMKKK